MKSKCRRRLERAEAILAMAAEVASQPCREPIVSTSPEILECEERIKQLEDELRNDMRAVGMTEQEIEAKLQPEVQASEPPPPDPEEDLMLMYQAIARLENEWRDEEREHR
jgi:hypothetical protein